MKKLVKNQSIQNIIDQLIRHYRIPESSSKEDALNSILLKIDQNKKSKYSTPDKTIRLRVASFSAAAVAAAIVIIYLFTATIQYSGVEGKSASIRLPDNSRVVIETGELSLKKYFWNRKVKLEGAAYFEVEKGSTFSVNTEVGKVEVLGTRFFVSDNNETITVQCFEGKVNTEVGENSYLLTAGNQVENVGKEKKAEISKIDVEYPEVAVFKGNYRSVLLNEIAADLDKFFGVKVEINVKSGLKFTGTIETGKVENALEIVCSSLQLNYKFTNSNTIQIYKQ